VLGICGEVCELEVRGPLKVLDATGKQVNRLGTDANFFATADYAITQAWVSAFRRIGWRCSKNGGCEKGTERTRRRRWNEFTDEGWTSGKFSPE